MTSMKRILWLWFLIDVYTYCVELEYRTFRCNNGTYIGGEFICDGKEDCIGDYVEENPDYCDGCGPGEFRCSSYNRGFSGVTAKCVNATARCDIVDDCYKFLLHLHFHPVEKQDELNCGDEVDTMKCTLNEGKYLCHDRLRCLDFNYTCDGFCNCFDCSDEKAGCSNDGYLEDPASKSHAACFKTPNGPVCCSEFDSLCQECSSDEMCDQKCVQFVGKQEKCFCDENYVGVPATNNSECFLGSNVPKETLLLYSTSDDIQALNLFTNVKFTVKKVPGNCTALTAAHEYIYYATDSNPSVRDSHRSYDFSTNKPSILKTSKASNEIHEIIQSDEIITSLAVDWITNNVYYTTSSSLIVCSNIGAFCKQLKSNDLIDSVYLAPKFGFMFWVSHSLAEYNYFLMKSSMDGSNENILIDSNSSDCIKIMTVDESAERIYVYCASSQEIRSITFNGCKKKSWRMDSQLHKGFIFDREIFYIDSDQTRIFSEKRKSKAQRFPVPASYSTTLHNTFNILDHLHVYNPGLQRTKYQNPCRKSCPGLCLLRPSSSKGFLNYTCFYHESTSTEAAVIISNENSNSSELSLGNTFVITFFILLTGFSILLNIFLYSKHKHIFSRSQRSTGTHDETLTFTSESSNNTNR